jgi:hypothetical protein
LRAWERDLAYVAAGKLASFGRPLDWPEDEEVALRFILDHAQDLPKKPGTAQDVAMELIAIGLCRALACPAPATLDRRIASWQMFHRMRNLPSLLQHAVCLFRSAQQVLSRRSGWNWPAFAIRGLIRLMPATIPRQAVALGQRHIMMLPVPIVRRRAAPIAQTIPWQGRVGPCQYPVRPSTGGSGSGWVTRAGSRRS